LLPEEDARMLALTTRDLASWIKVYDDIVPADYCDSSVKTFEEGVSSKIDEDWRRCHQLQNISATPLFESLKIYVRNALERFRVETGCGTLSYVRAIEDPNLFRYEPDEVDAKGAHRFHRHADAWSLETASRQVSIILYLNDVEQGGETVFQDIHTSEGKRPLKICPRRGRMLVFPSNYLFEHEGLSPVSGRKYILVSWLHFGETGHAYRTHPLF
jgi:hypothetical protein